MLLNNPGARLDPAPRSLPPLLSGWWPEGLLHRVARSLRLSSSGSSPLSGELGFPEISGQTPCLGWFHLGPREMRCADWPGLVMCSPWSLEVGIHSHQPCELRTWEPGTLKTFSGPHRSRYYRPALKNEKTGVQRDEATACYPPKTRRHLEQHFPPHVTILLQIMS